MAQGRILIAGNDKLYVKALADTLMAYGHEVVTTADGTTAIDLINKDNIDLVISEEHLTPINGRELLRVVSTNHADIPVILIADFGSVERAVQAMREGATDYLVKPIESSHMLELVGRVIARRKPEPYDDSVIARDPYSRDLLQLARKVASQNVSILISGESGTGKEVLARYIHKNSQCDGKPFVAINCAAIPENMLEAVLFGHEKGAYTGATQSNPGKFEQAQGGTLLLDEISEMELGLQAKLLRVLQEREVERLGSHTTISLDVRVLATTNRNLREEVDHGRFREDLYYRLNVFPLELRPLRERTADIIPLANHLIRHHTQIGQSTPILETKAGEQLEAYSWPGNVRELSNVVQRALVLCNGYDITANDLHFEAEQQSSRNNRKSSDARLNDNLKSHESDLIIRALEAGNGSRKYAADKLGISPRTLRYKLARMRDQGMEIPPA